MWWFVETLLDLTRRTTRVLSFFLYQTKRRKLFLCCVWPQSRSLRHAACVVWLFIRQTEDERLKLQSCHVCVCWGSGHCPFQTDCPSQTATSALLLGFRTQDTSAFIALFFRQTATALLSDFPLSSVVDQRTKLLFRRKTSLKLLPQTVLKQHRTKNCSQILERLKRDLLLTLDIVADLG